LHEAAPVTALRPDAKLALDHRRMQRTLGRVARRFDLNEIRESPEIVVAVPKFSTEPTEFPMAAEAASQQQCFELSQFRRHSFT